MYVTMKNGQANKYSNEGRSLALAGKRTNARYNPTHDIHFLV